jgi:hypothetical protein
MPALAEFHQEAFRPLDRIMSDKTGDNILLVDDQINQWVFAHDNRGRKVELDCVNGNVWRAFVGNF